MTPLLLCASLLGGVAHAVPAAKVGLVGEMVVHPGLFAGVESSASEPGVRPVWSIRGGGYVHPGHHTGLFALGEGGLRMTPSKGALHVDAWLGAGLHHRFLPRRVVVETDDGLMTRVDAGRPSVLGSLQLRVGDRKGAIRPFVAGEVWLRGPDNGRLATRIVVSLGVAFGGPS